MAVYEKQLTGDVAGFMSYLDDAIARSSATGKLEDQSEHAIGDARMLVRVYERYSAVGGNRVSLSVSALAVGESFWISAITSGGSEAMFFKVNTFGEESFLNKAAQAIDAWPQATSSPG